MTTLLLVGSAVVVFVIPGLSDALIFDRDAIARGQWWRIVTGSWVHFSATHLAYDGLAVLIAGWLLQRERAPLGWLAFASALGVGLMVLAGLPTLTRYAGLSGVAYGLVVYVALLGLAESGVWRRLCITTLALLLAKLTFEIGTGRFLLVPTGNDVQPVPLSHAAGALTALVLWLVRPRSSAGASRHMSGRRLVDQTG